MKYFYITLFLLLFSCCAKEEILDINYLKDSGYTEIICKDTDEYENQDTRFIEFSKKLLNKKSFLIARCFNKDSCLISMAIKKDRVICQRYFIDKSKEDKRDYISGGYNEHVIHRVQYLSAEYDSHRVLYLSIDKGDVSYFVNSVN